VVVAVADQAEEQAMVEAVVAVVVAEVVVLVVPVVPVVLVHCHLHQDRLLGGILDQVVVVAVVVVRGRM